MRPLCGVLRDGCEVKDGVDGEGKSREATRDERGGITRWGGRCHDLLGTRCDPYGEWNFFWYFDVFVNHVVLSRRDFMKQKYCGLKNDILFSFEAAST